MKRKTSKLIITICASFITFFCSGKANQEFDIDYFGKKFIEVLQANDSAMFYEEFLTTKETYLKWANIFLESDLADKLGIGNKLSASIKEIEQTMQIYQWGFDECHGEIRNWIHDDSINLHKLQYKYSIFEGTFITNDVSMKNRLHVVIEYNKTYYVFIVIDLIYIDGKYSCSGICLENKIDRISEKVPQIAPLMSKYFNDLTKQLSSLDSASFFDFVLPDSKEMKSFSGCENLDDLNCNKIRKEIYDNARSGYFTLKEIFDKPANISILDYIYNYVFNDSTEMYFCDEAILFLKVDDEIYKLNITDLYYLEDSWKGIRVNYRSMAN